MQFVINVLETIHRTSIKVNITSLLMMVKGKQHTFCSTNEILILLEIQSNWHGAVLFCVKKGTVMTGRSEAHKLTLQNSTLQPHGKSEAHMKSGITALLQGEKQN